MIGQRGSAPFGEVLPVYASLTTNLRPCSRDVILRGQDKQMLGCTKAEIRSSLRISTETLFSQPALSTSPMSDQASKGITITETESPVPWGRKSSPPSRDASSVHTHTSSPARNHEPPEEQLSAEITSDQSNLVDARERDLEPAPSTSPQSLSGSSTRSVHSHLHSPSILNLGRRSVVRKRLAEMQNDSTSGTSPFRVSRRPALHRASHFISHEHLASNSEPETVPEVARSGNPVNIVEMPAAAEQLTGPESSQVSPLDGLDSSRLTSPVSATSGHTALSSRPKSAFRLRDEMRARDSPLPHHHHASEIVDSQMGWTGDALLDVMDVHAERQLIKTAELSDQLEAIQNDVRNAAANVRVSVLGREEDSRHLTEIHTAVDDVRSALAHLDTQQHDRSFTAITQAVDERLRSNQAEIFKALEEIQAMLNASTLSGTVEGGAQPGPTGEELSASSLDSHSPGREHVDLEDIRQQLNMLVELLVSKADVVSSVPPQDPRLGASRVRPILSAANRWNVLNIQDPTSRKHVEHVEQVVEPVGQAAQPCKPTMHNLKETTGDVQTHNNNDVLQQDEPEDARAQLMEQQAESVRYLNELNTVRSSSAMFTYDWCIELGI